MAGTHPSAPMPSEPSPAPQALETSVRGQVPTAPERFIPSTPTVVPEPVWERPADQHLCGNCPGWKQQNPRYPFGQCLPAMRALGQPMYTPHLSGCMLDPKLKEKGAHQ